MQFTDYSAIVAAMLCSVLVSSTLIEDLGEGNCNWHTTSWCNNLSNAKDCKATELCIEIVWEQRLVPVDSNPVCLICKDMIQQARNKLSSQDDEVELAQIFGESCEQMPTQLIQQKCNKNTRNNWQELIKLMYSQMSHEQICTAMELCNSEQNAFDLEKEKTQMEDQLLAINLIGSENESDEPQLPQCLACKTAFRLAKRLVRSHTTNEKLKKAMNRGCNKLGKAANKCHRLVNSHGDQLARFARNPKLICSLLGMCFPIAQNQEEDQDLAPVKQEIELLDSEELELNTDLVGNAQTQIQEPELTTAVELKGSPKCSLCRAIIKTLQHMVHSADRGSIERALHKVCQKLGKLQGKCEIMVQRHGSEIVHLMTKKTAGRRICKMIGMCGKSIFLKGYIEQQNDNSDNREPENEAIENNQSIGEETLTDLALKTPKCSICKTAMKTLQHMVRHHTDKGEITRALAHICHKMGKMQHECENIVNNHGAQIVDLMIKHTPVQMICKAIHVCRRSRIEDVFILAEDLELV